MMSQIHTLRPLGEGADPMTFYAPLGCTTDAGRLYRRDAQYGDDPDREDWRVEVCFFSVEDGLSGWKSSALVMGRGWFVPISAEAAAALEAYMDKLGPVNAATRDLGNRNASLSGARSRLKLLESSGTEDDDLLGQGSPKQWEAAEKTAELEADVARLEAVLEQAEALRQEAQDALLAALGWEELLGGEDNG